MGAVLGQRLAPQLSDRQLRLGFAALLIGSAQLTGVEAIRRQNQPLVGRSPSLDRRLEALAQATDAMTMTLEKPSAFRCICPGCNCHG